VVEVRERAALAAYVDQIRHPPVQQEAPGAGDFQHVAHARRLLDVTTLRPGLPVLHRQRDTRPQPPLGGVRRTAHADLARFGRAVDLQQPGVETLLDLGGELLRQSRGGGYDQIRRRQRNPDSSSARR